MTGPSKQFIKYAVVENVIGNIAQKTDIFKLYLITKNFEVFVIIWKGYFLSYFKIGGFENPVWEYWDAKEINNNCSNSQ